MKLKEIDIVYVLKSEQYSDYSDLRYSLRSLKYIEHRNVYVIGGLPNWIRNIHYVNASDSSSDKQLNVINKLRILSRIKSLSSEFILMNDDFIFLQGVSTLPYRSKGTIQEYIDLLKAQNTRNKYIESAYRTMDLLGGDKPNFSAHLPIRYKKVRIKQLFKKYKFDKGVHFGTLYCNEYRVHHLPIRHDTKRGLTIKKIKNMEFISLSNETSKNKVINSYLYKKFDQKSIYEV